MNRRASWKGHLAFADFNCEIGLYSALTSTGRKSRSTSSTARPATGLSGNMSIAIPARRSGVIQVKGYERARQW